MTDKKILKRLDRLVEIDERILEILESIRDVFVEVGVVEAKEEIDDKESKSTGE
tara:strand:+ start:228 stop:389 length:162 start_codon:yes stop_codon:yes gene_type:complete